MQIATTLQPGMTQTGETYFRVNVFYLFLDYMLAELNDRFLCHRTKAFLAVSGAKIHADFIFD